MTEQVLPTAISVPLISSIEMYPRKAGVLQACTCVSGGAEVSTMVEDVLRLCPRSVQGCAIGTGQCWGQSQTWQQCDCAKPGQVPCPEGCVMLEMAPDLAAVGLCEALAVCCVQRAELQECAELQRGYVSTAGPLGCPRTATGNRRSRTLWAELLHRGVPHRSVGMSDTSP